MDDWLVMNDMMVVRVVLRYTLLDRKTTPVDRIRAFNVLYVCT